MSMAPRSETTLKQRGSTTGAPQVEQDAAKRVVDLLIVLVLALAEAGDEHVDADCLEQVRVAERGVQRNDQCDLRAGRIDDDAAAREPRELRGGVGPRRHRDVELA